MADKQQVDIDLSDDEGNGSQIKQDQNLQLQQMNSLQATPQHEYPRDHIQTSNKKMLGEENSANLDEIKLENKFDQNNNVGGNFEGNDFRAKSVMAADQRTANNFFTSNEQSGDLNGGGFQFEKSICFRPLLVTIRRSINLLGALLAITNVSLDIIYAYQTPYQWQLIFQITCALLILRVIITQGISQFYYQKFVRNYKPNLGKFSDQKELDADEEKELHENGVQLYSSMHLLLYTGSFRLLHIRDFKNEVWTGYMIELVVSTIPMLFCQVFNNYEAKFESYTPIQSLTLASKFLFMAWYFIEISMMFWESRKYKQMQKDKIPGSIKLTEDQRKAKYGKMMFYVGIFSIFLFLTILIGGVSTSTHRVCGPSQSMELAVCIDCADDQCLDCSENSQKCEECKPGYMLNSDGKCIDCDLEPYNKCLQCRSEDNGESTICEKCNEGYRLDKGKCTECDDSGLCLECNNANCIQCKPGNRLYNGVCQPCSDSLNHCEECANQDECLKCDYHIAELGIDNKCSKCREENGWYKNYITGQCNCKREFVNILQDNLCQDCNSVIPGCKKCEQTDDPGKALSVEIGYDSKLSVNKGKFVKCVDCGKNMVHLQEKNECRACKDMVYGCKQCNIDGSECEKCEDGYFLFVDKVRGKRRCGSCKQEFQNSCENCSLEDECSKCEFGYRLLYGKCFKRLFSF